MNQRKAYVISRVLSFALVLVMLLSTVCVSAFADSVEFDDSDVLTDTLLLINTQTGDVLYSKNSDVKRPSIQQHQDLKQGVHRFRQPY